MTVVKLDSFAPATAGALAGLRRESGALRDKKEGNVFRSRAVGCACSRGQASLSCGSTSGLAIVVARVDCRRAPAS